MKILTNKKYRRILREINLIEISQIYIPQELIASRPRMHKSVCDYSGSMTNWDPYSVFGILQDQHIGVIATDQKLQVQIDGHFTTEDTG